MENIQLSKNFYLYEFLKSQSAVRAEIDMTPNDEVLDSLRQVVERVLQPLRVMLGRPIIITSGFRPEVLNKLIGGSISSQHCKGQAVDFYVNGYSTDELVSFIRKSGIKFDQLIDEFGAWVHVSLKPVGSMNRCRVYRAERVLGAVVYREI